ncbi:ribonuclease D [Dongia soli]|uniref:Ribonuclease D n=1 Tax=Dongia soli TaxID=600628 RepID=A0ABU5EGN0_9PROT|nr:ribonuclease D [Dongia soli]MDY0885580.1 ribonuclease D [Dongia soli]
MNQDVSKLSTSLIADSAALRRFIQDLSGISFVTIDTEFLRDKTYWPQLCLVQIAGPQSAAAIDTLAPGIDLTPLIELLADRSILKVFHAARQDVEIFFRMTGKIPGPIVDTQVMAMVCGYGDAASYETLATKLANASIDKSSRFTDWSRRPLTDRQLKYALSDVTYLRVVYEKLQHKLESSGRTDWVADEMAVLTDPATYTIVPEQSWQRLKIRSDKPRFLAVLREIAAWREREAQERDIPRSRLIKDEQLLEIAAHPPRDADALAQCRGLTKNFAEGRMGEAILAAVKRALDLPETECPRLPPRPDLPPGLGPLVDLLRVLLKTRCDQHEVAQKLIANADDLERIAADDKASVAALSGWRRKVFGEEALALKHGKLALTAAGKKVKIIPLPDA